MGVLFCECCILSGCTLSCCLSSHSSATHRESWQAVRNPGCCLRCLVRPTALPVAADSVLYQLLGGISEMHLLVARLRCAASRLLWRACMPVPFGLGGRMGGTLAHWQHCNAGSRVLMPSPILSSALCAVGAAPPSQKDEHKHPPGAKSAAAPSCPSAACSSSSGICAGTQARPLLSQPS